jgi:MinD-like ATPase involved in chromosome partitioning or flagellar assembly
VSSIRVLIIDPDTASSKYLAYSIKKEGFETFIASSGKEGLIAAWRERPNILIIEPQGLSDISFEQIFKKLRSDHRTAQSIVIVLSLINDPNTIAGWKTLGVDHCFKKEAQSFPTLMDILKSGKIIHEPLSQEVQLEPVLEPEPQVVPQPQEKKKDYTTQQKIILENGRLITFLSAKGGTGTSSICANTAGVLATDFSEHKVAVLDLVLPVGSIAHILGYEGSINIFDISQMEESDITVEFLQQQLPPIGIWNFQFLAGCPTPEQAQDMKVAKIPHIISTILQGFDYVFVDIGRSLSWISLPIILDADQVVFVIGPDEATVHLTDVILEYLRQKGLSNNQLYPFLNRAVGLEGLATSEIEELLNVHIMAALPHIGRDFVLANNLHQPLIQKFPDDAAAFALRQLAQELEIRAREVVEKGIKYM